MMKYNNELITAYLMGGYSFEIERTKEVNLHEAKFHKTIIKVYEK